MDIDPVAAQRLFQAVVTQALIDATSPPVKLAPVSEKLQRRKAESDEEHEARRIAAVQLRESRAILSESANRTAARNWLTKDMESFPEIVSLAGYNAQDIRERARKLERAGWKRPSTLPEHALAA